MSNIKVGDRVTCVNASGSDKRLIEGRDYIVYDVSKSPCCNVDAIDVGLITSDGGVTCMKCGKDYLSNIAWKRASRFVKKEESESVSAIKLTKELHLAEN